MFHRSRALFERFEAKSSSKVASRSFKGHSFLGGSPGRGPEEQVGRHREGIGGQGGPYAI